MKATLTVRHLVEVLNRTGRPMLIDEIRLAVKALYGIPAPSFWETAWVVFGPGARWITRTGRHRFSVSEEAWGDYWVAEFGLAD